MVFEIDKTHSIFGTSEYLGDIVPFNLMEVIKQSPLLLVSNEKNFIIGMTAPQMPIWVWTAETIDANSLIELCEYFYNEFNKSHSACFVAKPEFRIGMESFENTKVISAKNKVERSKGILRRGMGKDGE